MRTVVAGRYAFLLTMLVAAGCTSSTPTTPTAITPATFVMTWPNLTFPTTGVGASSTPLSITLTNSGTAAVPVTSVVTTNAAEFPFTTTCQIGGSLPASSSCNVTTRFTPSAIGARSATITIKANGTSQDIPMAGTGATINPQLTIAPAGDVAPNVFVLSGTGMTPNGLAELHTTYTPAPGNPPNVVPTTTWLADASGNVAASATDNQPGTYEHWLLDLTSGVSTNHVIQAVP